MIFFIARPFGGAATEENSKTPHQKDIVRIKNVLKENYPDAIIFDPWEVYVKGNKNKFDKDYEPGRTYGQEVYRRSLEIAGVSDVLISFLPTRSMGTADEMSAANRNNRLVICISPEGIKNWTVITHTVYKDNHWCPDIKPDIPS